MNINSLSTKITLIFIFTIASLLTMFIFFIQYEKQEAHFQVSNYHEKISNYLFINRLRPYEILDYVTDLNFKEENNPHSVFDKGKIISSKRGYETILKNNTYYLHILTPHFKILFKDLSEYKTNTYAYLIFISLFILLFIIYFWLIKSIKPLLILKEEISKFSNGDMDINCRSNNKDEIAAVANEFDNAAKQISLLLSSRQLFLRTIMHELKTPIAKGRIVSELVDDDKQKNRLISIFERLELQINDFSRIEQVVSKNYSIVRYSYPSKDIINNAIKMLMIDKVEEKISFEDISTRAISIDKDLFSMAIKNLIDNAIKYSEDRKVLIKEENNEILFISKGEILKKDIAEYFKPFHNETKSKNHGMGLGLYIVYEILQMHKFSLEYIHEDNINIFKIKL